MVNQRTNGVETGIGEPENDHDGSEPEIIYGSGTDTIPTVEPSTIEFDAEPGESNSGGTRRRGRPKGSRNSGGTKQRKETASDLSGLLLSLHFMAAAFTKVEELELSEPEAKKIADAVQRINELYGNIVLPEKTMAWINLAIAGGTVYGPRMVAYNLRMKKERKEGKHPVTIDANPNVKVM